MKVSFDVGIRVVLSTFNWTVPWLSWLLVTVLCIVTLVLYYVPLRILILLWGINKFTKKLRAPNAIPNNELLDYLSRVPSDKELVGLASVSSSLPHAKVVLRGHPSDTHCRFLVGTNVSLFLCNDLDRSALGMDMVRLCT